MSALISRSALASISRVARHRHALSGLRYASSKTYRFNWEDPLMLQENLTEDERAIAETARDYCQEQLLPRVTGTHWQL